MSKYLDQTGLAYLWSKIQEADDANAAITETALANKGGYIEYSDGFVKLWENEAAFRDGKSEPISKFNASAFVNDGMLDDVDIVTSSEDLVINYGGEEYSNGTKFIRFKWNTAAGENKVDYLKVDEIGKVYAAGAGISIDDANNISVSEVKTDITKTSDEIEIIGGPLETALKSAFPGGKIPAGTTMQDVLLKLACTEKWPTSTSTVSGEASVSIAAPTFTLGNSGTTVEVGTLCTLSNVTLPSAAVPSKSKDRKVTGFTNGYSAADDNTRDSAATEIVATVKSGPSLTSDNYVLSIDYTGFDGETDAPSTSSSADYTAVSYTGKTLTATEGSNKVSATVNGPKATITFNALDSYFACSNLKKTRSGENVGEGVYHKSTALPEYTHTTSARAANTAALTVTAKYKFFFGYSDIQSTDVVSTYFDSAKVRALTAQSGWLETSGSKVLTAGEATKSLVVAFPKDKYILSDAQYTDGSDMKANFDKSGTVSVKCGANENYATDYTVLVFPNDTGAPVGFKNITIKRK